MSNDFTLDADSPSPKPGQKFNLTKEEQEGAALMEEERHR